MPIQTNMYGNSNEVSLDFNELSERFLKKLRQGGDTKEIQELLAATDIDALENHLKTNEQKTAFWLNIYNAYIQVLLKEKPELYTDRAAFFKAKQIQIAGKTLSFAEIEHGLVRKSQWEYCLGYIRTWFPNQFERKLRVDKRDYRIHFALNCGAKDCPPVAIYEADRLDEQLTKGTELFLKNSTTYDNNKKQLKVTSLFSWFRGDFGGKAGTKRILKQQGFLSDTKVLELIYSVYDWTLHLDNFIEL